MAFFDWLQRTGSVGSVVKWAYRHYSHIHFYKPELTVQEICDLIFKVRYQSHVSLSKSAKKRLKIIENIEINSIIDLCMFIYQIEMEIRPLLDFELYKRTESNATIVLNRLNEKNKTNYR